ncbi:MAG: class I SAM-dependent RNA methyltransferase [Alphaproteobacteria bacterium]
MQSDAELTLEIIALTQSGEGLTVLDGKRLLFAGTAPGDKVAVTIKNSENDTEVLAWRLVEEGEQRQTPPCRHFSNCGGCQTQHVSDRFLDRWKLELLREQLIRAKVMPQEMIFNPPIPKAARRRISVRLTEDDSGRWRAAMNARQSHELVLLDDCLILHPTLKKLVLSIGSLLQASDSLKLPVSAHLTATETGADILLQSSSPPSPLLATSLSQIATSMGIARVSWIAENPSPQSIPHTIFLHRDPKIACGKVLVNIPSGCFLQPSQEGQKMLTDIITGFLDHLPPKSKIAELFCGIGSFTFPLAETFQITALDSDHMSINALQAASKNYYFSDRIQAMRRDLFRQPMTAASLQMFKAIVINPPRQGAEAQCKEIAASTQEGKTGPKDLIYISCSPATFARDAAILIESGWKLHTLSPVDQFSWTGHLELVASFRRTRGKN